MALGRRRPEEPGSGSGINIGGNNDAPLQNVVGQNISQVYQSASVHGAVDIESVRELLASFRTDIARNENDLYNARTLRAMADDIDSSLTSPDERCGVLRRIAQDLPALVAGTAVQQGGEALANALAALTG
ncbi:hypothetical protein [Streptomyces sp. NPDC018045]|uniref:hypothetical protein n=1 Tax=Streptomyces sp. NPDC018045 TaxID=3365037 RepID=UPI003792C609